MICSTVLHLYLLRIEEQEETLGKHKHTKFSHVFAHDMEFSHSESGILTKMA